VRLNPLEPEYGATLVDAEDAQALLPAAREALGEPILKAALFDLEQALEDQVMVPLRIQVYDGSLGLDEVLNDRFLRELHGQMYGDIWTWAGRLRTKDTNIGVASETIAVELRMSIETLRYRWDHTDDWGARELGMAIHAETVRIHPFADGNGRATRRFADLVYAAAQDDDHWLEYDWDIDKHDYVHVLRRYDATRDSTELAAFIRVIPVAGE
jgi:fido (protein-threonine AMPylation protein)